MGPIASHECAECGGIRSALKGRIWQDIPDSFAEEFAESLPLLTEDAYRAFLPVWLRAALAGPNSEAATMLLINLASDPPALRFSEDQATAVLLVARTVVQRSFWGPDDEDNARNLRAIEGVWCDRLPASRTHPK